MELQLAPADVPPLVHMSDPEPSFLTLQSAPKAVQACLAASMGNTRGRKYFSNNGTLYFALLDSVEQ